ncbi:MAG: M56 family metallopeptidase [Kiritimatiellae bacterium]|nr:M56 family metallopeptidase [Kiritimatiellia bacterium]
MAVWLHMADSVLAWLVRTSFQASVLVLLIFAVQKVCGRALRPAWRHGVWLLVLVRLLMPVTPSTGLSVFNVFVMDARDVVVRAAACVGPHPVGGTPASADPAGGAGWAGGVGWLSGLLILVWLAGVVFLAARLVVARMRLRAHCRALSPLAAGGLWNLLDRCRLEMGVRTRPALVETARVQTPGILGVIRPRLLLPEGMSRAFDASELRFVFLHELGHLKRGDHLFAFLTAVLGIVHWFNPLVRFAFSMMQAERELACDALVLGTTDRGENRAYGRTIIRVLERMNGPVRVPGLAGILEDLRHLKYRIESVARFAPGQGRWPVAGAVLLLGLALTGLTDAARPTPDGEQGPPVPVAAHSGAEEALRSVVVRHVRFERTSVSDVIRYMNAAAAGAGLSAERLRIVDVVWPEDRRVSLELRDASLLDVLREMTGRARLAYDSNGRFVWVLPR